MTQTSMNDYPMKILIIASLANSFLGFRKPLLLALVNQGLDVHVTAPDLLENSEVALILKKHGIKSHNLDMQRTGLNPFKDLKTIINLYSLIKKVRPDITLGYTVKPVIYGLISAWLAKVPKRFVLITGLGYAFQEDSNSKKRKIIKIITQRLYRFSLNHSHRVFFQNPDDKRLFRKLGILHSKTPSSIVNGSGVDLNEYPFTEIHQQEIRFLFIGRLLGDKGIREYIEAAKIIKNKYPDIKIDIVGPLDSNPNAIQQKELDTWISSKCINYLGPLKDVKPKIAESSVFVLPSYREGTPRSTLEAMSMGRAIITTDAPGCRETVKEGQNGFLVPVKDAQALASAMEIFIQKPLLIQSMGRCSRKIAECRYDVNKVNMEMLKGMELITEEYHV